MMGLDDVDGELQPIQYSMVKYNMIYTSSVILLYDATKQLQLGY